MVDIPSLIASPAKIILGKIAKLMLTEIGLILNRKEGLKRLQRSLLQIQAIEDDVEERALNQRAWQIWLRDLRDVAYKAEDLLDTIAVYQSLRSNNNSQVQNDQLPLWAPHYINSIQKKMDAIAKEMENLCLTKLVGTTEHKTEGRPQTSSLIDGSDVYGRAEEKKEIIDLLSCPESNLGNVSVISIVGMGGIGKTTLAQVAYNDENMCELFELRMWVSVGKDFDTIRLTKSIIESATHSVTYLTDLDPLQVTLRELVKNKKFFLVLDDFWNENYRDWAVLISPLMFGKEGSKIVVTSRIQNVLKFITPAHVINLKFLSNEHCLSLFKSRAFFENANIDSTHPNLVSIGNEIVEKCKGLPLAAKTLGSLLNSKVDEDEWNSILKSEIWDYPEDESDILPALRLSYQYLPTHLKQCFAYCAIFPKGYEFDKDKLVLLWMAEGFIQQKGKCRMEDIGSDYFNSLCSRYFFQESPSHFHNQHSPKYLMHDLIHNLAQFVSGDRYFRMDDDMSSSIPKTVPHLSFANRSITSQTIELLHDYERLRSLLLLDLSKHCICQLSSTLFSRMTCLRVLDLSDTSLIELPNSIGNLEHLKYLDLSNTPLETLSKSVCKLHSLQTLILKGCKKLSQLPNHIVKLSNLRHLELDTNVKLSSMPPGIGMLTELQTLSAFVVSKRSNLQEMRSLHNLRGTLCILNLENVGDEQEAKDAVLSDKQYLRRLDFHWSEPKHGESVVQMDILTRLKPHKNLKELYIRNYVGFKFPIWLGDPSFSKLVEISLQNCPECDILPPLGKLPALKYLHIATTRISYINRSFCGARGATGFPLLETLEFDDMDKLVFWDGVVQGDLPYLRQLVISSCPKLTAVPMLKYLHRLEQFELKNCPLFPMLPEDVLPTELKSLSVSGCTQLKNWYDTQGSLHLEQTARNRSVEIDGTSITPSHVLPIHYFKWGVRRLYYAQGSSNF